VTIKKQRNQSSINSYWWNISVIKYQIRLNNEKSIIARPKLFLIGTIPPAELIDKHISINVQKIFFMQIG